MYLTWLPIFAVFGTTNTTITTVHVVQSCHLDVGFAGTAAEIINEYFTTYIPRAIETANELEKNESQWGLRFMAQAYYLSLYLDCPSGMGLECPSEQNKSALVQALKKETITYHAFPHNAELEVGTTRVLAEGIAQVHALDDYLGLQRKTILSQRDVPGITRSIIPLLVENNVTAISVGVNGASMYPKVPKIMRWTDPLSQKMVVAMWHPKGYGGYTLEEAVIVPGLSHALVTDWNDDNAGPKSADQIEKDMQAIQKEFPNAQIVASTFENFTQHLPPVMDAIPVWKQEIGDTWIYGVPSDPKKVTETRALHRAWDTYLTNGGQRDATYLNATRLMLKGIEHTWGRDVKSNLKDNADWSNPDFEQARTSGVNRSQFQVLEASWWEQREWGVDIPIQTLKSANHSLYTIVANELKGTVPRRPVLQGFEKLTNASEVITFGDVSMGFDATTGGLTALDIGGVHYASAAQPMFLLNYTTYSQADYNTFINEYCSLQKPPSWFMHDFGKPNDTVSNHTYWLGALQGVYVNRQTETVVLNLTVGDGTPHVSCGAPGEIYVQYQAVDSGLDVTFNMFNKTSTRLPESMFIVMNSVGSNNTWAMKKLGEWIPITPSLVVPGGSTHLHALSEGFRHGDLTITQMDSAVVSLGTPFGFPTPGSTPPDLTRGISSLLWNNLWGTNYVMWYPFNKNGIPVQGEADLVYRYSLRL